MKPRIESKPEVKIEKKSLAEEVAQDIRTKIKSNPEVEQLLPMRDTAQANLNRLQKALADYTSKKEGLEGQVTKVCKEYTDLLAEGKDIAKNLDAVAKVKTELTQINAVVEELSAIALPKARIELDRISTQLDQVMQRVLAPVVAEYRAKVNAQVSGVVALIEAIIAGVQGSAREIGVALMENTPGKTDGGVPYFFEASQILQKYLEGEERN